MGKRSKAKTDPRDRILRAIREDGRYPPEAYEFLQMGLAHTVRQVHGEAAGDEPRHVSGRELCQGLRQLALERWGLMAKVVLRNWNIRRTRDFGEMVYFLISLGLMGRQESDRLEDFDGVYDFDEAFDNYTVPAQIKDA